MMMTKSPETKFNPWMYAVLESGELYLTGIGA
jgi:hypothetical protein